MADQPQNIRTIPNLCLRMSDGTALSAHVVMPDTGERFPAIIEATPYRKGECLDPLWASRYEAMARHGYAMVIYDIRGTGDSQGVCTDWWAEQENLDGVEVVDLVSRQDWCSGAVGMWGLSYTAMTALHVAAEAPARLRAIVAVGGPDDTYTDLAAPGGTLRVYPYEQYAPLMAAYNLGPPSLEVGEEEWARIWEERAEANVPWSLNILEHQQLDGPFWRQRSIPPDYHRIQCPVFLITGWADFYPSNYLRAFQHLEVPKRVLVGPWEHRWPNVGMPGPSIDGYHEIARWFDHWLKGVDTGISTEPPVTIFLQSHKKPDIFCTEAIGTWRNETQWPPDRVVLMSLHLGSGGRLQDQHEPDDSYDEITYDPSIGSAAGRYIAGMVHNWGQPEDQRLDEPGSLVYTSEVLSEELEVAGRPKTILHVSSSATIASFFVKLCDVAPDGTSLLVSKGALNATHLESSESPSPITPGEICRLEFDIADLAHRFLPGHRLRVMIASSDFPNSWPTPESARNRVYQGPRHRSRLILPLCPRQEPALAPPQFKLSPDPVPTRREAAKDFIYWFRRDPVNREVEAFYRTPAGVGINEATFKVSTHNPAHARVDSSFEYTEPTPGGEVHMRSHACTFSDEHNFHHEISVEARVNGKPHFQKKWSICVPRQFS